jgi:hypothetical protein
VHAIPDAWLTNGGTGAQNYDEFADETEITEIISANRAVRWRSRCRTRRPDSLGKTFEQSPCRRRAAPGRGETPGRLRALRGRRGPLYRITGDTVYGLWCMVDTDQISTSVQGRAGHPQ